MECDSENTKIILDGMPRDREVFFNVNMDEDIPVGGLSGHDRLFSKKLNKGTAFTHKERQFFNIHGLLPYTVQSIDLQIERHVQNLDLKKNILEKVVYLWHLENINTRLFFKIVSSNPAKFIPILESGIDTPIISLYPSISFTKVLFVTIKDKGHVYEVLKNWPERNILNILVTDGAMVFSTLDLGVNSAAMLIDKAQSITLFARIKPSLCLPVVLDVGTDNFDNLNDDMYVGLRERRVKGKIYNEFIDEFMASCVRRWGQRSLVQFDDFSLENAMMLYDKYKRTYCCLNVDIHCCGASGLAGIFSSQKITKVKFRDNVILFYGIRAPNIGFAELCYLVFKREGLTHDDAMKRIWFCDTEGLITKNRKIKFGQIEFKFAQNHSSVDSLEELIRILKPTILIGCSGVGGSFTKQVLNAMEKHNKVPLIFALSKPLANAECSPEASFAYTKGRCLHVSTSILPPLKYGNRMYLIGTNNSSTITAGIALGIMCSGMVTVPDEVFIVAAERLADLVSPSLLEKKCLYPLAKNLKCCSLRIAEAVMLLAYRRKWATLWPEPKNRMDYITSQLYSFDYPNAIPETYCMRTYDIGTKESLKNYPKTTP